MKNTILRILIGAILAERTERIRIGMAQLNLL